MKQFKMALMAILTIFCISTLHAQTKKDSTAKHQHTKAYQCPMKCEGDKTYDKAGKCAKCGMDLKAVAKEHATAGMYKCPMKCEGGKTYDKAGKCPECGMSLKVIEKPVAAVIYKCPMKCEGDKTYDKAGKCPECGMNLKQVEIAKTN